MKLAIFGATGNVGREIIRLLEGSALAELHQTPVLIASTVSEGEEIPFGDKTVEVKTFDSVSLDGVQVAVFATPAEVSKKYIPEVLAKNIQVIDLSSAYRGDEGVPMVVHDLNGTTTPADTAHVSIADVATIQLATVLKPLCEKVGVKKVMSTMMYPTSYQGKMAMDELFRQSAGLLGGAGLEIEEGEEFAHQVAFNVVPQVGGFKGANTDAETGLLLELNRVLEKPVPVLSTAVFVPTFIGMSQAVTLELEGVMGADKVRSLLQDSHGINVIDNPDMMEYTTPYGTAETTGVFVSRIREDALSSGTLQMFIACDNLRAGAAMQVLQRLEWMQSNA